MSVIPVFCHRHFLTTLLLNSIFVLQINDCHIVSSGLRADLVTNVFTWFLRNFLVTLFVGNLDILLLLSPPQLLLILLLNVSQLPARFSDGELKKYEESLNKIGHLCFYVYLFLLGLIGRTVL